MYGGLWRQFENQTIDAKYRLIRLIGEGGFGGVFLSDHMIGDRTLRQVAVKLMLPTPTEADAQMQELVGATAVQHDHVLRCFDAGQCKLNGVELLYLVMELATSTLAQALQIRALRPDEAAQLLQHAGAALLYLHENGMVHRDLKPGNLLWVNGAWKLSDFGLLKQLEQSDRTVRTASVTGTSAYLPPEAFEGIISPWWDVWSLGVTLYEALTGVRPGGGDANATRRLAPNAVSVPLAHPVPEPFATIVRGCLTYDRYSRWTVRQVLQHLQANPVAAAAGTAAPLIVSPDAPTEGVTERVLHREIQREVPKATPLVVPAGPAAPPVPPPIVEAAGRTPPPVSTVSTRSAMPRNARRAVVMLAAVAGLLVGAQVITQYMQQQRAETQQAERRTTPAARTRAAKPTPKPQDPPVALEPVVVNDALDPAEAERHERTIRNLLDQWVATTKRLSADANSMLYAPVVDRFFTKSNVTRDYVRAEKRRSFNKIDDVIKYEIRGIVFESLKPDVAVVSFDKEWKFDGDELFSGAERQRLTFQNFAGQWKITREEELKVYWVRR